MKRFSRPTAGPGAGAVERVDQGMTWGSILASLVLGLPQTSAVSRRAAAAPEPRPDELDDFESHGPTLLKRRRRGDDERSLALQGLEISFDGSGESDAPHSSPCHRPPGSPGNPLDVPVSPVRSP